MSNCYLKEKENGKQWKRFLLPVAILIQLVFQVEPDKSRGGQHKPDRTRYRGRTTHLGTQAEGRASRELALQQQTQVRNRMIAYL